MNDVLKLCTKYVDINYLRMNISITMRNINEFIRNYSNAHDERNCNVTIQNEIHIQRMNDVELDSMVECIHDYELDSMIEYINDNRTNTTNDVTTLVRNLLTTIIVKIQTFPMKCMNGYNCKTISREFSEFYETYININNAIMYLNAINKSCVISGSFTNADINVFIQCLFIMRDAFKFVDAHKRKLQYDECDYGPDNELNEL